MLKLLICGSTFHPSDHQDRDRDHQDEVTMSRSAAASPSSRPKRSRKAICCRSHSDKDKNPYATRGLDRFSMLLADLEEKRRKIYVQSGDSEDISLVRFVSKNSNELVPIVIQLKDTKKDEKTSKSSRTVNRDLVKEKLSTQYSKTSHDMSPIETSVAVKEVKNLPGSEQSSTVTKRSVVSWKMVVFDRLRQPSYYLPVFVILILILLTVFGRSLAILCISLGWYIVPTLKDNSSRKSTWVKKKDYEKKLSQRKMASEGVSSPRVNK
ncbi:ZCF [Parasponia andersonii]|uniref:ZCF n=1 Tax=Parasponia andersonii TaxID=3476 RepID=A0A2P5DI14_PARAD|nr:ZCF [Parasponia andersonii]